MTGSQLKSYRASKGLSLRAMADLLKDVNHSTLSRWEQGDEILPAWVETKLYATTELTLPLPMLQQLMDHAARAQMPFADLLKEALITYMDQKPAPPSTIQSGIRSARAYIQSSAPQIPAPRAAEESPSS